MRVLFTVTGSASHTRPLVPLIRELARRGHEMLVAAPPELAELLAAEQVATAPVLPDVADHVFDLMSKGQFPMAQQPAEQPDAPGAGDPALAGIRAGLVMFASLAVAGVAGLQRAAEEFRPDLILRDDGELAAPIVAERLGIPQVALPCGMGNIGEPTAIVASIQECATRIGVELTLEPKQLYPYGRLDYIPGRYSFTVVDAPPARAYRQPVLVRPGERLPEWMLDLPADRPLVLGAVGMAMPSRDRMRDQIQERMKGVQLPERFTMPELDPGKRLSLLAAVLSEVDCQALVATGGVEVDPKLCAPHVRLVDHLPQPLVLECADLFVTHGGYNGIREAVRAGVPMVVQPAFGDQPSNAQRAAELGLGLAVPELDHDALLAACTRVLTEPAFAARAGHAKRCALALPDLAQAVTDLTELVAAPVPA